ncbi:unnamed protein product [Parascedosporium putredinis]|uniref:Amidohydrolase 3 domain-containing protein n=1 Tax=Parascedosporium putredinis TaxID=1442378 RepID=A0A9P1MFG6_9PEZI|nr:unnamed protein product [Parascedosporium putredinis]CAI8004992.1 unnamed protein product [Parascedosporium putredinis]
MAPVIVRPRPGSSGHTGSVGFALPTHRRPRRRLPIRVRPVPRHQLGQLRYLQPAPVPLEWMMGPSDVGTCPTANDTLVTFGVTALVIALGLTVAGCRPIANKASCGCLGKKGGSGVWWTWIFTTGLILLGNLASSLLVVNTEGYEHLVFRNVFALYASRPSFALAWMALLRIAVYRKSEYIYVDGYISSAIGELVLKIISAAFIGTTWKRLPNEPVKEYMKGVLIYMQVLPALVLVCMVVVPIWHRTPSEKTSGQKFLYAFAACIPLVAVVLGPWIYWTYFLSLPGSLWCPPKLASQGTLWTIFSILGGLVEHSQRRSKSDFTAVAIANPKGPRHSFANCLVIDNDTGRIAHVGSLTDPKVADIAATTATRQDMQGRFLPLDDCHNLADIRAKITAFAAAHPKAERILCSGWMPFMTGPGDAHSSMLEGLDPRPIFVDSKSLHSTWCNAAALRELAIDDATPAPPAASSTATPRATSRAVNAIKAAMDSYLSHGYTGLVEMAMEDNTWEALLALKEQEGGLPVHVAAYWLIRPSTTTEEALAQVDRVIELNRRFNAETSPECRIAGIKIICDGIVDACTAALTVPYSNGATYDMLWPLDALRPVVERAANAGLQCALHAIARVPRDARRLGQLGITASVQPVHADPAIIRAWPALLGSARCSRAFAYSDFAREGAVLALGSDAPTSPYDPFPNLYTATTRRSAREPASEEVVNPHFALSLAAALTALTEGSAYSSFADAWTGKLEAGKAADLAVIDMEWDVEKLLGAKVVQTWSRGKVVYDGERIE